MCQDCWMDKRMNERMKDMNRWINESNRGPIEGGTDERMNGYNIKID